MSESIGRDPSVPQILQLKPASWHWGRAIRAALCISLPFAVGLMFNDIMTGMWIAMGCLMMVTGEGSGSYSSIYKKMLIAAPVGALGYLLGYLGSLSWAAVVIGMMVVGFLAAMLSSKNSTLSIATLQTLLLASIALGVPAITPFWQPAILYLVGAAFYAVVLGLEALICGWHSRDELHQAKPSSVSHQHSEGTAIPSVAAATAFAVCLGVAYCAYWFDHNAHWFWIPLTVGLVMKPDFGSIKDRAIQRVIGTIAGVVIGAVVLATLSKGALFVAVMAVFAGLLPWAMQRSYILQAVFLTPLILMLVDVIAAGTGDFDYGVQRLVDTAIGGAIVIILGYLPLRYFEKLSK
ncbi:FUSC family protein [Brucella sp. 21LCYQ03]|nr:FUSC family protein [Brucella sp. 21LCYQ03]